MDKLVEINKGNIAFEIFFKINLDMLCIADKEGRFINVNKSWENTLGYPIEELEGRKFIEFVHPEDIAATIKIMSDEKQVLNFTNRYRCRDGSYRYIEWQSQVYENKTYSTARDITERIEYLSKQQAAQQKFNKLFDNNSALRTVSDMPEKRFTEVNSAFLKKLGYEREEVIGKTSEELGLFIEDEKKKKMEIALIKNGKVQEIILKVRKKDGTILDGLFSGEIIDNQGQKSFLTVMLDITQQMKNERELMETKTSMRAILDNIPFRAWLKDEAGRYIEVNKEFQKASGKTKDEIIGFTDYDIFKTEFAEKFRADDIQVMLSGKQKSVEELFEAGEYSSWNESVKTPIFDVMGKVIGTTGISRDVTERKRITTMIEEQKNFFKQMINAIPDLIFYKDKFSMYLGCNKAFAEDFIGHTEEEIIGKTDFELMSDPKAAMYYRETDREMLETQATRITVEKRTMASGIDIDVETIKTPFYDEDGKIAGVIGISRDITLRKKSEIELIKAKEAAEAANIMKSQFLANMSHEIRTPMNGIFGYLDLLDRTSLSSEQKGFIREGKRASEILLYLINDILDLSKIEAGKLEMEKITFDLRTTVEDAISIFIPKASEKQVELNTMIKSNVPEKIEGDPARIRQIISNLVGNAVKFTEEGEITVLVECIEENNEGGATIRFQIKDTGIGITKEQIDKLFKPFMQADASTTRKHGGTGLGLAISSELVKLMGGNIHVDSELGTGSAFNFSIKAKVMQKSRTLENGFNKLKGTNILIVDDNENNRKILRAYLEEVGCNIFEVDSADKALSKLILNSSNPNKIKVAIIDFMMPGMNGYELAIALKAIPFAKDVKLILFTSAAQKGDAEEVKAKGFEGYISKPVRRDELINCVSLVLGLKAGAEDTPLVTRYTVKETINELKPKILLVEDNEMNINIAVTMLKHKNITCDIATDGNEALKAVSRKDYDIVFMDCQMPIMDGYESTFKIREREGDKKHTIIIAMTANAMEGDREKCIQAGMDDYLSKPINFDEMFKIIEENTKLREVSQEQYYFKESNIDNFVEITGLDKNYATELFAEYIKYLPNLIELIHRAIVDKDFKKISELAHQLKGSSGTLRLNSIYEVAIELENSASNNEIEKCENSLIKLENLFQ